MLGAVSGAVVADRLGRRRMRSAVAAAREQAKASVPRLKSPEEHRLEALVALLLERPDPGWRVVGTPVTDLIHARLAPGDVATVEARLEGDPARLHAASDPLTRRRLALNFAAAYGVEEVLERAGLSAQMPPEEVHAMARGPVAAGGDHYLADLVFDALAHAGLELAPEATVLDFGGSSGRVLRSIAAGRPDLACLGCDPNADAIAWAQEHLPAARFFVSPQRPPLELADGSLDLVLAISIWSHFAEEPAVAWLGEMHRVIASGGALVLTTHAFDCLSTLLRREHISAGTAAAAATAMAQGRHHFVDVFGPDGDWGVKDSGWGNAYLTLEWLLRATGEDWAVLLNWPGALDQAQDVIVLQRR